MLWRVTDCKEVLQNTYYVLGRKGVGCLRLFVVRTICNGSANGGQTVIVLSASGVRHLLDLCGDDAAGIPLAHAAP